MNVAGRAGSHQLVAAYPIAVGPSVQKLPQLSVQPRDLLPGLKVVPLLLTTMLLPAQTARLVRLKVPG